MRDYVKQKGSNEDLSVITAVCLSVSIYVQWSHLCVAIYPNAMQRYEKIAEYPRI